MDFANLREHYQELLDCLERDGYTPGYVRHVGERVRWILDAYRDRAGGSESEPPGRATTTKQGSRLSRRRQAPPPTRSTPSPTRAPTPTTTRTSTPAHDDPRPQRPRSPANNPNQRVGAKTRGHGGAYQLAILTATPDILH
jgi:hypothetical protein